MLFRLTVDFLQQTKPIDGVNKFHLVDDIFHLVGLQLSDKMPADVGRVFFQKFLHAVFAENFHVGVVPYEQYSFKGHSFGRTDNQHVLHVSSRFFKGRFKAAHRVFIIFNDFVFVYHILYGNTAR